MPVNNAPSGLAGVRIHTPEAICKENLQLGSIAIPRLIPYLSAVTQTG